MPRKIIDVTTDKRFVRRERVRVVMRWAVPRMLLRHPILAIRHQLDGRRPSPALPAKPGKRRR